MTVGQLFDMLTIYWFLSFLCEFVVVRNNGNNSHFN